MQTLITGRLDKMRVQPGNPIEYFFRTHEGEQALNPLLGRRIRLQYAGEIRCTNCQRRTKTSFNQGYCYPCFQSLARCDRCIMSPELCHFAQGTCREPEWGKSHCMIPHVVYLANSSGLKVGITRANQIPTRWIDQGAIQAVPMFETSSRYMAGLVEVLFKSVVADKTNWRTMLKHQVEPLDMVEEKARLIALVQDELDILKANTEGHDCRLVDSEDLLALEYPSLQWPQKVSSYNLEKTPDIEDELLAIKGQYLILKSGCLNLRKYTSYEVSLSVLD